jgi:hypothetical protein
MYPGKPRNYSDKWQKAYHAILTRQAQVEKDIKKLLEKDCRVYTQARKSKPQVQTA